MEKVLQQICIRNNISFHRNQEILIASVNDQAMGFRVAKELLSELVDKKTALFLSGGRTPKELYKKLADEKKIDPGLVGLVDERYGEPMHEKSNELMLRETGFLDYLNEKQISFQPILFKNKQREELSQAYDALLRGVFTIYQKAVVTLGIGLDGHTAGIAGNRADFANPIFLSKDTHLLVSDYNDQTGMFKERITMTFLGLSMMDYLLVLVFGEDKKEALEKMFQNGSEEEIPSRFLKRAAIAKKTIIITDQQI